MRIHSLRHVTKMIVALAVFATASLAWGQVYKCADATGKTTYSDAPCDAAAKPHKLPEDPIRSNTTTNPHMCAQLLDETHRLDAEAERDAQARSCRNGRPREAAANDDGALRGALRGRLAILREGEILGSARYLLRCNATA